mgnify:CR=1 FL=1
MYVRVCMYVHVYVVVRHPAVATPISAHHWRRLEARVQGAAPCAARRVRVVRARSATPDRPPLGGGALVPVGSQVASREVVSGE